MNGGECSDHGRHSFKCDCPKATQNSTGYTDNICQTPVFLNDDGELSGGENGNNGADQTLAADQNMEFIILAIALLVLLLVLLFFVMRYHLRGKERVYINERGEAYVMDETTGTTKRADFDVNIIGHSISASHGGPKLHSMLSPVKRVRQITMIHGSSGHSGHSGSTLSIGSSNITAQQLTSGMLNSPHYDVFSSSDLTTSSDSSEDAHTMARMARLKTRRTSEMFTGAAFNHLASLKNISDVAVSIPSGEDVEVTISDSEGSD
jgi:hypothetical protein